MKIYEGQVMTKRVGEQVIYPELSYKLIQIAIDIHNTLGPGFSENIYQAAFVHELQIKGIEFEEQKTTEVPYKGIVLGTYRLDLVVEQKVIVELKAVNLINDLFKQQVLSYLKASGYHLGLLINFGSKRLEHIRILN
jgi:GxxExxY protein